MATIGSLVANLSLNSQPFTKGLGTAKGGLSSFASSAMKIVGPLAVGIGAALGGKAAIDAARTQIQAEKKLEGVLKATGGAAGLSAKQIKDYAAELQSVTNFGDETTIASAGVLASFKEVKGDVFKGALAAAQDMSAVMGTDLQGSVVQLGKALNDPTKGITALTRVGVTFTDAQKEQIKALQASGDLMGAQKIVLAELESEFGGAAKAMADPFTQAKNSLGDLAENIGFLLLPTINAISKGFTDLIAPATGATDGFKSIGQWFGDIVGSYLPPLISGVQTAFGFIRDGVMSVVGSPLFQQWIAVLTAEVRAWGQIVFAVFGAVWDLGAAAFGGLMALAEAVFPGISGNAGSAMQSVGDFLLDAMIIAEFAFQNWQRVGELAFTMVGLKLAAFGNDVAHFFTGVLPALFSWFSQNWREVFFTAFDLGTTVFINLGQNIRNMFAGLWTWIKSGFSSSFAIDWVPLTEGFHNAIRAMPEIPKRELGATEAALQSQVEKMKDGLSSDLGDFMTKRREELLASGVAPAGPEVPGLTPVPDGLQPAGPDLEVGDGADAKKGESKTARGIDAGTSEAFDAIMKAAGGGDLQAKTNQKLEKQTEVTREGFRRMESAFIESMKIRPKVASMRNGRPA